MKIVKRETANVKNSFNCKPHATSKCSL